MFTWSIDIRELKHKLYNLVLGASFDNVDFANIESIVFYIDVLSPGFKKVTRPFTEVRNSQQLQALSRSSNGVYRLKIHRQFENNEPGGVAPLSIKMEIRPRPNPESEDDFIPARDFILLRYFELYECSEENHINDLPLYDHKPYLWSLDVQHKESPTDPRPAQSIKIIQYSISGDGTHAATLSATDSSLYLDLWDISKTVGNALAPTDVKERWHMAPYCPKLSAKTHIPFTKLESGVSDLSVSDNISGVVLLNPVKDNVAIAMNAAIAVSWNADSVALFPTAEVSWLKELVVYDHSGPHDHKVLEDQGKKSKPAVDIKSCGGLAGFYGEAKFHIIDTKNPKLENQLFITCDGISVDIYNVYGAWSHVVNVQLSVVRPVGLEKYGLENQSFAKNLIDNIQGKYFTWARDESQSYIWDIEARSLASVVTSPKGKDPTVAAFSSDESMVAIFQGGFIGTYLTATGTAHGKYSIHYKRQVSRLTFIRNDSQIMVDLSDHEGNYESGYILDIAASTITRVDKFSDPGKYLREARYSGTGSQGLYASHGSMLNLVRLEDIIFNPDPHSVSTCGCDQENGAEFPPAPYSSTFTSESGLKFIPGYPDSDDEDGQGCKSFLLEISHNGLRRDLLRLPSVVLDPYVERPYKCTYKYVYFFKDQSQILIHLDEFITIWKLPDTYDGECTLIQSHWLQDKPFKNGNDDPLELDDSMGVQCCKHNQQLLFPMYRYRRLNRDDDRAVVQVPMNKVASDDDGFKFINGVMAMIELYKVADNTCKKAVVSYLKRHINRYLNPADLRDCVIGKVIESWKPDNQEDNEACESLLSSLLSSKTSHWIPRIDCDRTANPLLMVLEKTKTDPKIISLTKIIIQYCLENAREKHDHHFLSPITACQSMIWDEDQTPVDIALNSLRNMAFIPVNDKSFVIDNYVVAQPPGLQQLFTKEDKVLLHKYKNPILQLQLSEVHSFKDQSNKLAKDIPSVNDNRVALRPSMKQPYQRHSSSQNDYFTKGIYTARFDMLWQVEDSAKKMDPPILKDPNWFTRSWFYILMCMIWHTFKPNRRVVKSHKFNMEAFDNPAFEALIEYKWNTFGYKYWLIRFLFQCIYYILILTVVFMQVYNPEDPKFIFIAIIVFSGTFLWLEALQLWDEGFHDYSSSPFNLFDLVVFILPMAGSINQLNTSSVDISAFSFSVLFIFLHLLFELRTNRSVCHYSTIIIQVIGEIRVFFFIFAGGILAFSIALLHLLRGCTTECSPVTDFPYRPFAALSATYFFLGGNYDPVSSEFSQGDWKFHVMMAIFILFTVIIMLNVLIALINTAISTGDNDWQLVWLQNRLYYIETAENLSYRISSFRRRHNWFPNEVYYTATLEQVKAYREKFQSDTEITRDVQAVKTQLSGISSTLHDVKSFVSFDRKGSMDIVGAVETIRSNSSAQRQDSFTETPSIYNSSEKDRGSDSQISRVETPDTVNATSSQPQEMQALARQVEGLKIQLTETQSNMDRRVDELNAQLRQIKDLLLVATKREE
ncbi:hypothetical protein BGZ46_010537 [Entomortierella lignicola]|nr:hypothetical protein BGZ46_010537 [Entomortierella lignicola]